MNKKLVKKLLPVVFCFVFLIASSKVVLAKAEENMAFENATTISMGQSVTGTFSSDDVSVIKDNESFLYKFTVPQNIGNQWITFSLSNCAEGNTICMYLKDSNGKTITSKTQIEKNSGKDILTRIDGAGTSESKNILTAGNTYYIEVTPFTVGSGYCKGKYSLMVSSTKDDNWGIFEKASKIKCNQRISGKIEYEDDIDIYEVTLPKDKKKHSIVVTSTNKVSVFVADSNRVKINSTTVDRNSTNNSLSVVGKGQKVFIKVEIGSFTSGSADYTIKVLSPKKSITTLKLTSYKKNSKKIVGKTVKSSNVKVKVSKKIYKAKSNKKGKFTIKLSKKLSVKTKIKVTVSKVGYKTKTKTFKVKR